MIDASRLFDLGHDPDATRASGTVPVPRTDPNRARLPLLVIGADGHVICPAELLGGGALAGQAVPPEDAPT